MFLPKGWWMTQVWTEERLMADWLLLPLEHELRHRRCGATCLGFTLQLKFFQLEGRFAANPSEIPLQAVEYSAEYRLSVSGPHAG
jgi:hypothetical protein